MAGPSWATRKSSRSWLIQTGRISKSCDTACGYSSMSQSPKILLHRRKSLLPKESEMRAQPKHYAVSSNKALQPTAFWRCASMSILISVLSTVAQPRSQSAS
jgi:hypothetical protein